MRTSWKRRPDFAEHAEALGIATDAILAATRDERARRETWTVMYGGVPAGAQMYARLLIRNEDGILRPVGAPIELGENRSFLDEVHERLDRELGDGDD